VREFVGLAGWWHSRPPGIGQPDFEPPPHVIEAAGKALRDGHHGYTPANGIRPLREAIAADIAKRRGVEVDPGNVVIVPGAKVTMFFAMLVFGEPGAEILYPDPGFPIYRSAIAFSGATPVPIPLHEDDGFSFHAEEVLERITPRTRLIVLNSPANPTGGVVRKAEIDRLVARLEDHPEVAILSDEIYARLTYGDEPHVTLLGYESIAKRVILLDGFSKTYAMTGWRLGYAVWPAPLVDAVVRLAINSYSCVNAAAQWAGIAALQGPQDSVERMRAAFDHRRRLILRELNQIPGFRCVEPKGAFYAMPNITGSGIAARDLQRSLLEEAGVAVIAGKGYLRFSYAADEDSIMEAMGRIRAHLTGRGAA
jgi:aspartate/methionine/tyrosine aminotransferase